jgi:hypothetical protein
MKKNTAYLAVLLLALSAFGQNQTGHVVTTTGSTLHGNRETSIQAGTNFYTLAGSCKYAEVGKDYPLAVDKNKLTLYAGSETCKYRIYEKTDFPLNAHILHVEMSQGNRGIYGSPAQPLGPVSSISGGGSYLYHVFTVRVDGSNLEYQMTTRAKVWPQVGNYPARWDKKSGSLIIALMDRQNKLCFDALLIGAEEPIK